MGRAKYSEASIVSPGSPFKLLQRKEDGGMFCVSHNIQ